MGNRYRSSHVRKNRGLTKKQPEEGELILKPIVKEALLKQFCTIADLMYQKGWDERNGGNISMLLKEEDLLNIEQAVGTRNYDLGYRIPELAGKTFLVTGSGKYFKNIKEYPEENLGVIRVLEGGERYQILWGLTSEAKPTSELPTHLMNHAARLKADPEHRIVMHCHPANLLAISFVHSLDEKELTRTLWKMCAECVIVFPEGVGVLPFMLCGTKEIGIATAQKIADRRLVLWPHHGIFGTGRDLDEAFGLIETAEKAAEIYMKIAPMKILQSISDEGLHELADAFHVIPREGYLN